MKCTDRWMNAAVVSLKPQGRTVYGQLDLRTLNRATTDGTVEWLIFPLWPNHQLYRRNRYKHTRTDGWMGLR